MRHLSSSGVDPYSALSGAAGALFGERKSSQVLQMLCQIAQVENIAGFMASMKRGPLSRSGSSPNILAEPSSPNKATPERLMGFGHRLFKGGKDPRVRMLKELTIEVRAFFFLED